MRCGCYWVCAWAPGHVSVQDPHQLGVCGWRGGVGGAIDRLFLYLEAVLGGTSIPFSLSPRFPSWDENSRAPGARGTGQ